MRAGLIVRALRRTYCLLSTYFRAEHGRQLPAHIAETLAEQGFLGWALTGSNRRPRPCKGRFGGCCDRGVVAERHTQQGFQLSVVLDVSRCFSPSCGVGVGLADLTPGWMNVSVDRWCGSVRPINTAWPEIRNPSPISVEPSVSWVDGQTRCNDRTSDGQDRPRPRRSPASSTDGFRCGVAICAIRVPIRRDGPQSTGSVAPLRITAWLLGRTLSGSYRKHRGRHR